MAMADCNLKEQGFTFGLRFQFSLVEGAAFSMEIWEPVWGSGKKHENERICLASLRFSFSYSYFTGPLAFGIVHPVPRQVIPLSCQSMLEMLSQAHSADVLNCCSLIEFTVQINHDRALIEFDHRGDLGLSGGLTSGRERR